MTVSVEPRVNVVFISSMPNRCNLASITAAALLLATLPRPSMGKDPHISTIDVIPKQHRVNVNVHGGGCDFTLTIADSALRSARSVEVPIVPVKCAPLTSLSARVGKEPHRPGEVEAFAYFDLSTERKTLECSRNGLTESTWWDPKGETLVKAIEGALVDEPLEPIPLPKYDHICKYIDTGIRAPILKAVGLTKEAIRTSSDASVGTHETR